MKKVSIDVVIPLYNGEKTILSTLRSVLAQTRLPDHVYVVNDGSTDNGPEVVRKLNSRLITVIDTPNKGVSHARNVGIKASGADYLAFLDADDLWLPNKLEKQLELFSRNPKVHVVYCGGQVVSGKDHDIVLYELKPEHKGYIFEKVAFRGAPITGSASSVAVARCVFEKVGYFDETLCYSEDADMWVRLSEYYEFDYVSDPVVKIVHNPHSVTRNSSYEQDKLLLIQHLHYRDKIAKRFANKDNINGALRHIALFVVSKHVMPLPARRLFFELKKEAPFIMTQISKSPLLFVVKIYLFLFHHFPQMLIFQPMKRMRLFMRTGTFSFRKAEKRFP